MKKVAIYHNTTPSKKSQEKIELLQFYSQGVKSCGDVAIDVNDYAVRDDVDVGVIQGWVTDNPGIAKHQILRKSVINYQRDQGRYVLGVDSNLFLYANPHNPYHYLRYSFNGIFPNTGIYCDSVVDPNRWLKLSKNLNLSLKDYRSNGNHILVLLQRNGGWSMGGYDVQDWANSVISKIKDHTDRPIIVRAHPGDKHAKNYLNPSNPLCKIKWSKRVMLSKRERLVDDLKHCWAAVNYNSSPVVGAAIEGVPIFVSDPAKSQCAEIANTDLSMIENPTMFDRQPWVERLSMFHWNFNELQSGECWRHMRSFI